MTGFRSRSRVAAALAAVALAASLAACSTVTDARRAQDPASAVPGERTPTAAELALPPAGAVALDDLVRASLRAHPSVLQARRAAEAAATRVRQAEAAWLPQLSASASASVSDSEGQPGSAVRHRFGSLGFDVSWLVFDFGRTDALARNAAEQALAAQADLAAAEADVAFGVRSAYFDLAKRIDLLVVATETVRQFQEHLDQVRAEERLGVRIGYDVTKAEVDLGNARLTEVRARDALLVARATLATAVGLAEELDWMPALPDADTPAPAFADCWREAMERRPSLAAAHARERAASALVDAQVAALYPSVNLSGGVSDAGSELPLTWSLDAGPSVRWIPFDGWANLASIDQQVAALRGARASLAAAEQQAWLDVRTAWIALADARERVGVAALLVTSARENQRLAQARFDVGEGTSVELTDAQIALAQARSEAVQAAADRHAAHARLRRAVGDAGRPPEPTSTPAAQGGAAETGRRNP